MDEDIVQLTGALENITKAHKSLLDAFEKLKAEVTPQVKELPAFKESLAAVEKAIGEKSSELAGKIAELQKVTGKCEKVLAFLGGGDDNAPMLQRIDPGYFNPNQRRNMPNATAAKAMALFVHAVCTKSPDSIKRLEGMGVRFDTVQNVEKAGEVTDDELGGFLLPPEFGGVIISALPQYGIAPQFCDVETMAAKEKVFATDGNDVAVYPLEEGGELEEVDATYGQRTLVAKLFGAFTRWSADWEEYGLPSQGEMWNRRFGRAIAKKIDQCVFLGDGTSTYAGMVGVLNDASAINKSLPATKTAFADVTKQDVLDLIAAIPDEVYQEGNCRFFGSANMMHLLRGIDDGMGRPIFADAMSGETRIWGEDFVRTATYPRITASAAGTKFLSFGDLRQAMKLGIRTRMVLMFSPHAFFKNAQNALRVLTRFGCKSNNAQAYANLKTADA